jgi:hypothetical protein
MKKKRETDRERREKLRLKGENEFVKQNMNFKKKFFVICKFA